MTPLVEITQKLPLVVPYSDVSTWNVSAQFAARWDWEESAIHQLGWALSRRSEAALESFTPETEVTLLTIRFDGTIEPRDPSRISDTKGKLFRVHPGDVIFSKIDVRNGAIGIAPDDIPNMCATSEFPIYRVDLNKAEPDYIKILFQTQAFRRLLNSMISGASGRKRIQPLQLEEAKVPLPDLAVQNAIAEIWRTGVRALNSYHNDLRRLAHAMLPDNEFAYSPELHLTRLLSERLNGLAAPTRAKFGERPLTALWESARNLIAMDPAIAQDRGALTAFAEELFAGLSEIAIRLTVNHPSLCRTYGFFELAARVWKEASGEDHEHKVVASVAVLDRLGHWLGGQGITSLLNRLSPAEQLLETFKAAQSRIPKRVFLARWYPAPDAPGGAFNRANLRLEQLHQTLANILATHGVSLELVDMGTEEGGTFPIHAKMYEAIASADIIICDLTGQRPNVYIEAGYALKHHEQNKLIFLFEPNDESDKVPFDLNTFKYVELSQAAEIPNKIGKEIEAVLRDSGAAV